MGRQYVTEDTYLTCSLGMKMAKPTVRSQQSVTHDDKRVATVRDTADFNFICTKSKLGISTLFLIGAAVGLALFFGPFGIAAAIAIIAAGLLAAGGIGYLVCKCSYGDQRQWIMAKEDTRIGEHQLLTLDSQMVCMHIPGGVITAHPSFASAFSTQAGQNLFNLMDYAGGILCGYGGGSMGSLAVGGFKTAGMSGAAQALRTGFGQGLRTAYGWQSAAGLSNLGKMGLYGFKLLNYGFAVFNGYSGYKIATDDTLSTGEKAVEISKLISLEIVSIFAGAQGKALFESKPKFDPATATNAEKGVFGEAKVDEAFGSSGYEKLNGAPVKIGDSPKGNGIDGIYHRPGRVPPYVIDDAKYGSSNLKMTADGMQMSDSWILARLEKEVGRKRARDIIKQGYERVVSKVDKNGNIVHVLVDKDGKIIKGSTFTP